MPEDKLECDECGQPLLIIDDGVSHHLTVEDDFDYERDADHVAYNSQKPVFRSESN